MSAISGDNFSDSVSNRELLEKAKNEFNREKRLVIKNLPFNTTEKEIRAFMGFNGEFPVEEVSMVKYFNQAIVTLKDPSLVGDAIAKLNNTKLEDLTVNVGVYRSDKMLGLAHLPSSITEYQFRELVMEHGNIEKCFLMRSEETGESKGYGFVEYNEPIEKVGQIKCNLDWKELGDRVLHCDAVTDSSQSGITFQDLHSKCLVIDNLPPSYKDSIALRELFSSLVKPVYCQIVTKGEESLGFGIIEYDTGEDAEKAYRKFQKFRVDDVPINLSFCIPGKSAVHMFNRIMFKYGDKVNVNRASLLPDPVYPNPAFLKHFIFKTHVSKHPRLLVHFTDSLLNLQEGYVKQLEDKTNAKPGILGPPPTIPMSPLMDVNLQLGLLTLIILDMREKGTYSGEVPEPIGKLKIPTEEEFLQKPEPVSLLGDPMTAQANIIIKNLLMPPEKSEFQSVKEDLDQPKLLGRPIYQLNLVYLCSLGRLMAMFSDRTQSMGLLGNAPGVSPPGQTKPLIEGLMQAGKVAQSLLTSMGMNQQAQNQRLTSPGSMGPNQGLPNQQQGLLGNKPQPKMNNNAQAATNFMNTIQALAFQKLSESKEGGSQILSALFGKTMGDTPSPGAGLLGNYPGTAMQSGQNKSLLGKPKPLLNMNVDKRGDGLMPTPPSQEDDNYGYYGNQGGGNNYDDSGYQAGYESDYNEGYNDTYGSGYNDGGYGNYDMPQTGTGNRRPMSSNSTGHNRTGQDMGQRGESSEKFDGAYFSGINESRSRRQGISDNRDMGENKDYNRIAQQAAAYAAGAAAAYKRQYEEYMAQSGYGSGYSGGYSDDYSNSNSYSGSYSSGSSTNYGSGYGSGTSYSSGSGYSSGSSYGSGTYGSEGYDNYSSGHYGSGSYSNNKSSYGSYGSYSTDSGYSGSAKGSASSSMMRTGNTNSSLYNSAYSTNNSNSRYSGYGSGTGTASGAGSASQGSMRPPLPPGPAPSGSSGLLSTPQGQKRTSAHILPSPEPSPEGDYIGQHSQGLGGHYADTYAKRQRLTGKFSF